MKKNARTKTGSEATMVQLAFAALLGARETLHGAVMSAGLHVLDALLEDERARLCGPRYAHDPARAHTRHGRTPSSLAIGGRRVSVRRPRVLDRAGDEVALPLWQQLAAADPLSEKAVDQVLLGVSMRGYDRSIGARPSAMKSRGASKSSVSRRFVAATRAKLSELLARDISGIAIAALIVDALRIGGHLVLVAIGVDEAGDKHVLGLHEGATENSAACTALFESLVDRGLSSDRSLLVVIDGSKALAKAVRAVFGQRALVQRCQVHKKRNVTEHLPDDVAAKIGATITAAYRSSDARRAKRMLEGLARQIERAHPAAASSLREGLDETLTVTALGLDLALARTLSTTNAIEFVNGRIRIKERNVAKWTGGEMVLRWTAAALMDTSKTFRKLRGHAGMPKLVAALRAHDAKINLVASKSKAA